MNSPEHTINKTSTEVNDYFSLPKAMGGVSVDTLLGVADRVLFLNQETIPTNLPAQSKLVAASCLIEAALMSPNTAKDDIENQLEYISAAKTLFHEVSLHEYTKLEDGYRHPDDIEQWLRADIQTYYADIYRDIVCGEITVHHTLPQLIHDLEKTARFVATHQRQPYVAEVYKKVDGGLLAEVEVLLESARHYSLDHREIALPSTQRGGSGHHNRKDTHDIMLARQISSVDDNHWSYQYREIKSGQAFSLQSLARYNHPIIHVKNHTIKTAA